MVGSECLLTLIVCCLRDSFGIRVTGCMLCRWCRQLIVSYFCAACSVSAEAGSSCVVFL